MTQVKPKIRLYVPAAFSAGHHVDLSQPQSHYLMHVMRCNAQDPLLVFNGMDGEWLARIDQIHKKHCVVRLESQQRAQQVGPDVWLVFAPIKGKNELVVEKAVELGVSAILPAITRFAVVRSVNMEKLTAHAIEAAEQCERMEVPPVHEAVDLPALLGNWPKDRLLLYGDESGGGESLGGLLNAKPAPTYAVLVGPEGGFSPEEHQLLKAQPFVQPFSMGLWILRADTAAVAALACVQSVVGDWNNKPRFVAGN